MIDPKTGRFLPQDFEPRFWAKVAKKGREDCWLWQGGIGKTGYGVFWDRTRRGGSVSAHRLSWELANGPITNGLWVLHKCDVRACVNPNHLFLGNQTDNMQDAIAKGRHCRGLTQGFYTKPERRARPPKLDPDKVREIRQRVANGESYTKIGAAFDIGITAVHQVYHRKIYKHVT